jgi:hypothetical protein
MHWTTGFLGFGYGLGAQGPEAYDCWSFFRMVQRERFGREVPFHQAPASLNAIRKALEVGPNDCGWRETKAPLDGDAVLMSMLRHPTHIGIWVADLWSVLHCAAGSGSVLHDARHLAMAQWRSRGFYTPEV